MKCARLLCVVACLLASASAKFSLPNKQSKGVSVSKKINAAPFTDSADLSANEKCQQVLEVRGGITASTKQTIKVGTYFALWYALNIGYNIYNKKALNIIPAPWTVSAIQMIVGMFVFVPLWVLKLRAAPKLSTENVKTLMPIAAMHTLGHVSGVISLGAGAVSFTHIVKAAEPLFTALFSAVLLNQFFAWQVYTTLLPVIVGVGLASLKELTFSWTSFGGAMTSNIACALRGVFAKQSMGKPQGENMNASNLYSVLTILACLFLTPVALLIEATKLSSAWNSAIATGIEANTIILWTILSGFFYYTYNEVAFLALDSVHPITHAVGNTIKRVVIIITSMVVFKTKMTPLGALGSTIAILGVLAYSLAKNAFDKPKK